MPKYLFTLTMEETYELIVEADDEDMAWEIAESTDLDEMTETGNITSSFEMEEIND